MSAFKQTKQFQTMPSKKGEGEDKHSHAHGLTVRNAITKGCEMKLTVNGCYRVFLPIGHSFNPTLRDGGRGQYCMKNIVDV